MGVRRPGFEVFCDQQELFNVTLNALFCVLQVWQDFIRFVPLHLGCHLFKKKLSVCEMKNKADKKCRTQAKYKLRSFVLNRVLK